jgi:hypothetical protein
MTNAAPAPCISRPATSTSMPGATAQTSDATANTVTPATSARRRPHLSPAAAAVMSSTAKLSP